MHIADFAAGSDVVQLAKTAAFANLATAVGSTLQAADFLAVANAATAGAGTAHILYDTATGNLYYDSNGGDSTGRTLFATIDPAGLTGTVSAADFRVV